MKKFLIILGLMFSSSCYAYEFCSELLPEGCVGYQEGIHHLESYTKNGIYYIKIVPMKGFDFYKKDIPYKTKEQLLQAYDRNIEECQEYDNPNITIYDIIKWHEVKYLWD